VTEEAVFQDIKKNAYILCYHKLYDENGDIQQEGITKFDMNTKTTESKTTDGKEEQASKNSNSAEGEFWRIL
jgi:hypothetical protein